MAQRVIVRYAVARFVYGHKLYGVDLVMIVLGSLHYINVSCFTKGVNN